MAPTYPTKVDRWIACLLIGGPSIAVLVAGHALLTGERGEGVGAVGAALGALLLLRAIAWPMNYTLEGAELLIRSGLLLRQRIPYARFVRVSPSRNPLSSFAMSLDRLRIDYRTKRGRETFVLISPVRREAFLQDLAARCPHLTLRDGALQPAAEHNGPA